MTIQEKAEVIYRGNTIEQDAYIKGYEDCKADTFRWLIKKFGDMTVAEQYFNEMKGE